MIDSQTAFEAAIEGAFLSENPADGEDYAGNWMYMGPGRTDRHVVFKHIETRESFSFEIA